MRDLLAVDGSSLAHRAWHSTRSDERADEPGVVTAAFASMLATTWQHGPYPNLLIAFDDRVNRRRLDFPEYKAQRAPSPPELRSAIDLLSEHLEIAGVAVRILPGAEADDVLAATVDAARLRDWRCDVLSSDRDLTALVDEDVRLLRPRQRFADLAVEDAAAVLERYGVEPSRYPDLAALRGDVSDGLTGAKGIGPSWAARLVRDHGSVTAIYAAMPDLPPRIAAALRDGRDAVERNLLLMAPLPHLEIDVEDVAARGAPLEAIATLIEELGFPAAAARLRRALTEQFPPRAPHPATAVTTRP
jgi:DNA polymerase-1